MGLISEDILTGRLRLRAWDGDDRVAPGTCKPLSELPFQRGSGRSRFQCRTT